MSNMSYCRFENTLRDLKDCYENLDKVVYSEIEHISRIKLVKLCQLIIDDAAMIPEFDDEDDG